ncbi:hypothetical protein HDU87_006900 [Geranomyces variabilis]|uniref:Histidine kinase n=1 Tax=Geranomyces variabilis TaxID=109894 RepID=A0AAD5XKU0_9FUNG|nr:hypothetical protein HDU87_006900 [Geranomyces variabilis]
MKAARPSVSTDTTIMRKKSIGSNPQVNILHTSFHEELPYHTMDSRLHGSRAKNAITPDQFFARAATSLGGTVSSSRAEANLTWWQRFVRIMDPRRSIKSRLSLALLAVSIIFLATSASIVGTVVEKDLKESSGTSLVQIARTAAQTLYDNLFARYRDLAIISTLPFVRDPTTPAATLQDLLDKTANTYTYYSWIGIALNNGIAASNGLLQGRSVVARPWFIACKNATINQAPYIGDVHGAVLLQVALNLSEPLRLLDVAVPLFTTDNVQYGTLAAHVNASMTQNLADNVVGYLNNQIAVSVDLFIVSPSDMLQAPVGETNFTSVNNATDSALSLARAGLTGYRVETWPNGIKSLTAYTNTPTDANISLGFAILIRQHLSEAYATADRLIFILVGVHVGFAILFVAASYATAHITTAPLLAIARAADNIRKRAAMPIIPLVHGNDEIALLSRSLNSLVCTLVEKEINLKGINDDLVAKVEEIEKVTAELRASEENFRQLADSTESAFFIVEFDATMGEDENLTTAPIGVYPPGSLDRALGERWNVSYQSFVNLFGLGVNELKENHTAWVKVVDPANLLELSEQFAARRSRPLDVTFRIRPGPEASNGPSGRTRHISLRTLPVVSSSEPDQIKRVIGVFQDVTRQTQAELESSNKSSWVRQVGHEIRNPLGAQYTMINLLLEGASPLSEEQIELLQLIRASNDSLLSLINSILDLAKLEAGEMSLETIPFNLLSQVEDVLDLMAPQANAKGIRIGCFVDPAVCTQLKGDPLRLRQIIINLFTNALKFTKTGSVFLHVDLHPSQRPIDEEEGAPKVGIRFRLTDTGIGISRQNQDKLFKEFAQAEESTSRQYGGTGLGLSIVKRLVQMMDGDVGIESELGKGSTFFLNVIFLKQSQSEVTDHPKSDIPQIGPKRVLLVSLWSKMHELIASAVAPMGAAPITVAHDSGTAITLAQNGHFDLAIMDVDVIDDPAGAKAFETLSGKMAVAIIVTREKRDTVRHLFMPAKVGAITDPVKIHKVQSEVKTLLSNQSQSLAANRAGSLKKLLDNGPIDLIDGEQINVMLVEDNPINQKAVGKLLYKLTNVPPAIAGDGQICLDTLAELHKGGSPLPHVILMDVSMPVMDGLTATRLINEIYPVNVRPIIIIMTANALHEDYLQCMQSGAEGYLLKPASKEVLRKTLEQWWTIVRARRAGRSECDHRSATSLHLEDETMWD